MTARITAWTWCYTSSASISTRTKKSSSKTFTVVWSHRERWWSLRSERTLLCLGPSVCNKILLNCIWMPRTAFPLNCSNGSWEQTQRTSNWTKECSEIWWVIGVGVTCWPTRRPKLMNASTTWILLRSYRKQLWGSTYFWLRRKNESWLFRLW